jgi:hypothetical protein
MALEGLSDLWNLQPEENSNEERKRCSEGEICSLS